MRLVPLFAPVTLSIGMLALFLDLELKLHVFRFYTAFRVTSPMSWGAWILVGVYPAAILLGLVRLGRIAARHERLLEKANVILGIALGAYTGVLLSTLSARALWNSAILGPLFLVSGISTGAALVMLFAITHEEHAAVRRWDVIAIGAELLLLAIFFVQLTVNGERGRAAAELFFGGSWTAPFWALVVIAGLAVPLLLEIVESKRALKPSLVTPVLLLAGGLALRWIFVAAGQAV